MDNKKQRFKIVISRKSNGKIHEFVLADDFTYEMALDFARNHFPFSDCSVLSVRINQAPLYSNLSTPLHALSFLSLQR